jgi:hypothetical protein
VRSAARYRVATPPAAGGEIILLIRVQLGWAPARAPGLTCGAANGPNRIDQRLEPPGVVHVGRQELHGQRHALPIHEDVVFGARLAAISRIRSRVLAAALGPHADAIQAGTAPVDQVQIASPVQDDLVHLAPDAPCLPLAQSPPASVLPLSKPTFCGRSRQRSPWPSTYRMPTRAAWGGMRGGPAVGRAGFGRQQRLNRGPEVAGDGVVRGHPAAYAAQHAQKNRSLIPALNRAAPLVGLLLAAVLLT